MMVVVGKGGSCDARGAGCRGDQSVELVVGCMVCTHGSVRLVVCKGDHCGAALVDDTGENCCSPPAGHGEVVGAGATQDTSTALSLSPSAAAVNGCRTECRRQTNA